MFRELFDYYVACRDTHAPGSDSDSQGLREFLYHISRAAYGPSGRADAASVEAHGAVVCDMLAVSVALWVLRAGGQPTPTPSGPHTHPQPQPHCYSHSPYITRMKHVNVEVETEGRYTRGQTVVDWGCYDGVSRVRNVYWILELKADIYLQMFKDMFVSV